MSTLLTIIALGLFLGMRHATDPDHVIAVTTIVSRERTMFHAAIVGALWGVGHTVTIVAVGSALIFLRLTIPPTVGLGMEFAVALMLILLGLLNLTGFMSRGIEWLVGKGYIPGTHTHVVFGRVVLHTHETHDRNDMALRRMPAWCRKLGLFHVVRPLAVGIVHGLAGSAAVTLLVLATVVQSGWAITYLVMFGVGTIIGMMLITTALAFPFAYTQKRFARLNQVLAVTSGLISVSFGLFLCYDIGIVGGLFAEGSRWMSH